MSGRIIIESMLLVTRWGISHRLNQVVKLVQKKFRERKN